MPRHLVARVAPAHLAQGRGVVSPVRIGDLVKVGQGKTLWRITGFWLHGTTKFANLQSTDREWVTTSSTLDRLQRVEAQP